VRGEDVRDEEGSWRVRVGRRSRTLVHIRCADAERATGKRHAATAFDQGVTIRRHANARPALGREDQHLIAVVQVLTSVKIYNCQQMDLDVVAVRGLYLHRVLQAGIAKALNYLSAFFLWSISGDFPLPVRDGKE
jgi:hypothetical protein